MSELDRDTVIERDRMRKALRETVRGEVEQARHDLHPATLLERWTDRQKTRLQKASELAAQKAQKNAPLIAAGSLAVLLFAFRKPISKMLNNIQNRRTEDKETEL